MAVPRQADLHRPVLEIIADAQGVITHRQIMQAVIHKLGLSAEDQRERTSSGAARLNTNVSYAEQYLMNAGLLSRFARGTWNITPQGRVFLLEHPGPIPIALLKELTDDPPSWPRNDRRQNTLHASAPPTDAVGSPESEAGPDELVEAGFRQMERDLVQESLGSIGTIAPERFEELVVDLLETMGYGEGRAVGRSGDGGIDGVINQDSLGLDKVYVQAKRWSSQVGEPEIRNFSGSLDAKGASKGVFITNSTFSSTARRTAEIISAGNKLIRLVDGNELAQLMIKHGVGVVTEYTYEIKKLDENYFAEDI